MVSTNEQRIAQALNILQKGLRTFVEDQMRSVYRDRWLDKARMSLEDFRASYGGNESLDVQALIRIANDKQHRALYSAISPKDRNLLHELRDVRNRYEHRSDFNDRDVESTLDTMELFLKAIQSPEAARIEALRRPVSAPPPAPEAIVLPVVKSGQLGVGEPGRQKGLRLFRYFADQANRGRAVGISYGDFVAFLHGKTTFREVAGRNYLPSDSGAVIELAASITDANGGRIAITAGGRTLQSGMDTYIWPSGSPFDRPEKAWLNPKNPLPYTRAEWKAVFPDSLRRMIKPDELARLG